MNFGKAIEAMELGKQVRRTGWNGKGMYIYLVEGDQGDTDFVSGFGFNPITNEGVEYDPYIVMFTAQGTLQPGWVASQADMLAKDWEIV